MRQSSVLGQVFELMALRATVTSSNSEAGGVARSLVALGKAVDGMAFAITGELE
jgi:hypothetical protein